MHATKIQAAFRGWKRRNRAPIEFSYIVSDMMPMKGDMPTFDKVYSVATSYLDRPLTPFESEELKKLRLGLQQASPKQRAQFKRNAMKHAAANGGHPYGATKKFPIDSDGQATDPRKVVSQEALSRNGQANKQKASKAFYEKIKALTDASPQDPRETQFKVGPLVWTCY